MSQPDAHVAFSAAVRAAQEQRGSRQPYARMDQKGAWQRAITNDLAAFIAERDSFYLATASADGMPYVQHRGGALGFLQVLDATSLAFAEFSGNKQYITLGNLSENDRAFIFLMDYANRRRVKLWGRAHVVESDAALSARLTDAGYVAGARATVERAIVFRLEQWDANCPQHIRPRFADGQLSPLVEELTETIADLEAQLANLRAQLVQAGNPAAD